MSLASAEWYVVRRAVSRQPRTYRCPFCEQHLLALTEHVLLVPEGDARRRRHAHTACALTAREAGRLPTREEAHPPAPGRLRRLLAGARARRRV